MGCYSKQKLKEDFLAEMKRNKKKTFTAWKIVHKHGKSMFGNYQYSPGIHKAKVSKYRVKSPRGIHVFMNRDGASNFIVYGTGKIFPVECNIDDVIRVGSGCNMIEPKNFELSNPNIQIVLSKIRIKRNEWNDIVNNRNCKSSCVVQISKLLNIKN